jgi:protein-S-isoprenylcysteine O-methyltransferase Ste14
MMRRQRGYLYEVPLLVLVCSFLAAVLYPNLPPPWNRVVIGLPVAAIILFLIYGWRRRR